MFKPPQDIINIIDQSILNLIDRDPQSTLIGVFKSSKNEIKNLRHHLESISKVDRVTSTQMNDLLIKTQAMVDIWNTPIHVRQSMWVEGKDE